MFTKLPVAPVTVSSQEQLKAEPARAVFDADVLLDAILGTGFRPPVSGLYAEAIAMLNASSATVVAVDIPSGADADVMGDQVGAVARADAIVTFTAPRPAHIFGRLTAGPTMIAPIGSPDEAIALSASQLNVITARDIAPLIGPRPPASNKGSFGHVLVLGGAVGKAGSVAMAGMAVLRVGAGLSTVATARSALATVAGFHPELMTEPLDETASGTIARSALQQIDSLAEEKDSAGGWPGNFAPARNRRAGAHGGQKIQTPHRARRGWIERLREPFFRAEEPGRHSGHHAASRRNGAADGHDDPRSSARPAWMWPAASPASTTPSWY